MYSNWKLSISTNYIDHNLPFIEISSALIEIYFFEGGDYALILHSKR